MMAEPQQKWQRELKAHEAFVELMKNAQATQVLFQTAGLELPGPLARFLGLMDDERTDRDEEGGDEVRMTVTPFPEPSRPPEWQPGWIWTPVEGLIQQTLVLAFLRREGPGPVVPKQLHKMTSEYISTPLGSIYNIGKRLDSEVILRAPEGWRLRNEADALVLHEGFAWGPPEVFKDYDLTFRRRMAICRLLKAAPNGLQIMQIVRYMEQDPNLWIPAFGAVSKDNLKGDLEQLERDGKIRRTLKTRIWRVVDDGESKE